MIHQFDLSTGVPRLFQTVVFEISENNTVDLYFEQREDFRRIRIPLNETPQQARQRRLDEQLLHAAGLGQIQTVKSSIADGANIDYLLGGIHPTPVRFAANGGHVEVVDYLLKRGARITRSDLASELLAERARILGVSPQ